VRAHAGFLRDWFRQWRAVRKTPGSVGKLAARHPWLMSWAEGEFAPGSDRHLGKLADCLRQTDFKIGWLYNPVAWLYPIEAIAAAVERSSRVEPAALVGQSCIRMTPFALPRPDVSTLRPRFGPSIAGV
jgi:hypothetical protein